MIRRAIEGHLTTKTLQCIRLQRKEYEWKHQTTGFVEEDGATMLKILVDILKPSLKVGLKEFKDIIANATTKKYNENPIDILNAMEEAYDEIIVKRGKTQDSYMANLFPALLLLTLLQAISTREPRVVRNCLLKLVLQSTIIINLPIQSKINTK